MKERDTKKFVVYYASEENCYEEDFIGTADTIEECKAMVAENLADDFSDESEVADAVAEIDECGWEGYNEHGYHIVYSIGEPDTCLSYIYGLQEDFMEEFDED